MDGQGQPCVPPLSVGAAFGTELVRGLRDAVLDTLDENERTRNRELSGLEASRRTELTEELEERLRRHWPRTGRAEVQQRQPRETELTSHRLRYERYVRSVAARLRADRSEFDAALAAAKEAAAAHTREMQVLAASLPSQTSLAALQGVQTRAKALRTEYRQQCVSSLQGLLRLVRDAPQRLLAGTDEFLRSCILFDKGGDYDEEEVQAARAALADSDAAVRAEARERRGEAEGVRDLQQQALESYDAFEREFAESLQDLSMREGLGKKYGAPRRQAQEAVRSEMARSEREEAAIDAKLDALASLCDSTSTSGSTSTSTSVPALDADLARDLAPVEAEGDGTAAGEAAAEEEGAAGESDSDKPLVEALAAQAGLDVKAGGPHSVAGQVRLLLRLLRRALVYRAVYLDFLPDVTKAPLTRVDDGELPPRGQDWLQPAKAAEDAAAAPGAEGKGKEKGKGREKGKEKGKGKEKDQGGGAGGEEEAAAAEPLPRRQSLAEVANEAASACRDATRALYEAEGVAASLGEGGVPAALERFLDKQRRQVEEARVAYARRLREQVARLHSLLLHAPASALDDVMRRCAAAGDSAVSTALDSFSSRVAAWRKKRCAHEAALRPSLADPNRTAELAQLRSQELERSRSARSAAVATHREALRALQAAATSASVRTAHVASQLLVLVDSIVTEEQMGSLPGDEEKLHPRRGLKRLRKLRRRQAAKEGGEGGESDLVVGDDVRKPKRRWPGAPVSRLRLPDAALEAVYVEDAAERGQKRGGGDAEAGEGEKEEKEEEGKDKGKDEEEAKGGGDGDDAFSAFAAVPPDMHSPPLWSTVTSAARALMRHRDSALDAYSKDFEDAVSRVEDRTREFVREEATWADAWVVRTDALAEQQRQQSS